MKGVRLNKRPIKKIMAKHMPITKTPRTHVVDLALEEKEIPNEEPVNVVAAETPNAEEKKPKKKSKKVAGKKAENGDDGE